jgi:hypothetical protein
MACIPSKMPLFGTQEDGRAPECFFDFAPTTAATPCQRGEFGDLAHRQSTYNTIGHMELSSRWFGGPRDNLVPAPTAQHF